jgi:hypothetical protein
VTRGRDELLAAGRQRISGRETLKQSQPETLFERTDAPQNSRVIDTEAARRARQ